MKSTVFQSDNNRARFASVSRCIPYFALLLTPIFATSATATVFTFDTAQQVGDGSISNYVLDTDPAINQLWIFGNGLIESGGPGRANSIAVSDGGPYIVATAHGRNGPYTNIDFRPYETGCFGLNPFDPCRTFTLNSLDLSVLYLKRPDDGPPLDQNATEVDVFGNRADKTRLEAVISPTDAFTTYTFTGWTNLADVYLQGIYVQPGLPTGGEFAIDTVNVTDETAATPELAPVFSFLSGLALIRFVYSRNCFSGDAR